MRLVSTQVAALSPLFRAVCGRLFCAHDMLSTTAADVGGVWLARRCLQLASLYRGAGWTAARNAPGSFALFGANSWAKEALFDGNTDQYWKTLVTSTVGGTFCLHTPTFTNLHYARQPPLLLVSSVSTADGEEEVKQNRADR
jgi:hypothetical protein